MLLDLCLLKLKYSRECHQMTKLFWLPVFKTIYLTNKLECVEMVLMIVEH